MADEWDAAVAELTGAKPAPAPAQGETWDDAVANLGKSTAEPKTANISFDSRQPASNLGEFVNNFGADFMEDLDGLKALGSAAGQRWSETIMPKGILQPEKFAQNPYDAMLPYSPIRPDIDVPMAMQAGSAMLDHYKNAYADPIMRGDFGALGNEFLRHPLNMPLDIPVGGGIGKAVGAAGKTQLAGRVAKAARAVPLIDTIARNVGSANELIGGVKAANNQWVDELAKSTNPVREAYEKIPLELRDRVIQAGEMRDLRAHRELAKNADVQNFWKLADQTDGALVDKLIAEGAFTANDHLVAKYGPLLRRLTGMDEKALHTPEGLQSLNALKAKLDAQGRNPVYFGLVKDGEASNAAKNRKYLFGDTNRATVKDFKETGPEFRLDPDPEKPQGFTRRRVVGDRKDYHTLDAFKAWETRYIQGLRFLKLRDFFGELLKNPELAKGGQVVDVHKFFGTVAFGEGLTPESMQYFLRGLPEQARLPKLTATIMQKYLQEGKAAKAIGAGNTTLKTLMLGGDIFWNINQQLQNAMIGVVATLRSPRDVAATFMAHLMMQDKALVSRLPAHWFGEITQDVEASGIMEKLKKFAPPIHYVFEKNFGAAGAMDNYWRGVMGLYSLMRGIEKTSPDARVALTRAFDLMARHDQVLGALDNPAVVESAGREIVAWFGDYGPEQGRLWSEFRAVLPFWLWYMHAMRVTISMTTKTPLKNALIVNLQRVAPDLVQGAGLTEAEGDRGAVVVQPEGYPLTGPNGGMLTRTAGGFTPFAQAPDLAVAAANIIFSQGKKIEGLAFGVVPTFTFGLFGINLSAGAAPFRDPTLIQKNGKQYDPATMEEVQLVGPNWVQLYARAQFPRIEAAEREATAAMQPGGPYRASDMTNPLEPKVMKNQSHPEGVKAFDPFQQAALTFFKSKPTEQLTDENKSRQIKKLTQHQIKKAMLRQKYRLKK